MRNKQFIDLEEIVEKPLLAANFHATAGVHSELRNAPAGLSVRALIWINETWRFYNECIVRWWCVRVASNPFTKREHKCADCR
jgi:hypothetical protein